MNETGLPTYLINDKEYVMVAADEVDGDHGLPLYSNYILKQLHYVIKAVK